jgi:signal transduction histidine kinase
VKDNSRSVYLATGEYEFIKDITTYFSSGLSYDAFLEKVAIRIKDFSDCECVGIRVVNHEGFIPYAYYTGFSNDFWEKENWISLQKNDCICTRLFNNSLLDIDAQLLSESGSVYITNLQDIGKSLDEYEKGFFRGNCILAGFETLVVIKNEFTKTPTGAIHIADKKADKLPFQKLKTIELIAPIISAYINLNHIQNNISRLNQLHLIGEMAASLGHEVRNPITAVRGFLQFFERKKHFEGYKDYLEMMISQLDLANTIITEFLSLAKNKVIDKTSINLSNLINSILPLIRAEATKAGKSILFVNDSQELIIGDVNEIKQVVFNLVRNGLDVIKHGQTVTIKTSDSGNNVILSVKDEGPGIPHHILPNLGKPFFSTKNNGTGLGLSMCYAIAARHNAEVEFRTGANGTTFEVIFPKKAV